MPVLPLPLRPPWKWRGSDPKACPWSSSGTGHPGSLAHGPRRALPPQSTATLTTATAVQHVGPPSGQRRTPATGAAPPGRGGPRRRTGGRSLAGTRGRSDRPAGPRSSCPAAPPAGPPQDRRPCRRRPPPLRPDSEELMRDVAGRDRSLAGVLSPTRGLVTAAEVMGGLFSPGECPAWQGQDWQPQAGGTAFPGRQPTSPTPVGAVSPTSCSAYYNLSAGKAELLNKMKALPEPAGASSEEEGEEDRDLARKKVQLIESISRKLAVLQEAQRGLQEDVGANLALGREVEGHVQRVCRPQECEKFRLFLGDLDKVVNLLLSLSGRLARVENALGGLDADTPEEEKAISLVAAPRAFAGCRPCVAFRALALLEKKRQLTAQLEDAQELQEHVARRERLVFACVSRCLPSEPLQDYQHFVRMKSALAVQQRQLDDKIKLGEEQLRCLRESLRRAHREY
ncbi:hypothetical protein lerEdw1_009123 [Lerista edwardsae]|nr:hypothetical protein lerEdw1_009123 [Lerista edwardsae]